MTLRKVIPSPRDTLTAAGRSATLPLVFQPAGGLSEQELEDLLELSGKERLDFFEGLLAQAYQAYRVGSILLMVSAVGEKLLVHGIIQQGAPGAANRSLAVNLRQLAKAWDCTRIETTTDSVRMRRLLELLGATVGSWNMVMEV